MSHENQDWKNQIRNTDFKICESDKNIYLIIRGEKDIQFLLFGQERE